MDKKWNILLLILAVILIIVLIFIGILLYLLYSGRDYSDNYLKKEASGEIINPAKNMSHGQAIGNFDESFVYYVLYSLKAYNLHPAPFSDEKPKMEFVIGEDTYNAIINEGEIIVAKGPIDGEDIVIQTSKEEIVKMLEDEDYIRDSFNSGGSTLTLVAGKTELAGKGYINLYTGISGKSIVGFLIFD